MSRLRSFRLTDPIHPRPQLVPMATFDSDGLSPVAVLASIAVQKYTQVSMLGIARTEASLYLCSAAWRYDKGPEAQYSDHSDRISWEKKLAHALPVSMSVSCGSSTKPHDSPLLTLLPSADSGASCVALGDALREAGMAFGYCWIDRY